MSVWLPELLLRSQSDERLVGLARAGHDRAFATIVERYRPELLILARRLNSDGRAEDVLQQAFLSAFVSLRSGTEVGHLRGWLYQIVRNAATKLRPPHDLPLDDVLVSGEPLEDIVQRRARALSAVTELARLPERQRDALVAIALNGLPRADVAVTMGVSEGALRQLVHRARTTLRGAATAVTPWPLARWLAASPASGTDVAAAAGMVSAGGVGAKVSALLATGVLATTIGVLPPPNHGPIPSPRHHLTGPRNAGPDRVALVSSPAGARRRSRLVSGTSRSDGLANRSHSERQPARPLSSSANAIPHHHLEAGRAGVAGVDAARRIDEASRPDDTNSGASNTHGGPGGLSSPNPGSGRHGDGAPGRGSVTSSDQDGSASSGASTQGAAASSQSDRGGGDGENVQSDDGSGSSAAAALDGPGPSPGSGQDGEGDGGTSGSGSGGGGHGDSSSSGGSTDTETTPDR
jgi:RNA polymerase sigma factor (sigma-70 family)